MAIYHWRVSMNVGTDDDGILLLLLIASAQRADTNDEGLRVMACVQCVTGYTPEQEGGAIRSVCIADHARRVPWIRENLDAVFGKGHTVRIVSAAFEAGHPSGRPH